MKGILETLRRVTGESSEWLRTMVMIRFSLTGMPARYMKSG
ncbi:MAG: hypothetical protein ACYDGR_11665 [Candidatus Dormibacteria bacterium]